MLQYNFNWKTLSAMAGLTFWGFYFRLYPGTVKSPEVIDFLEALVHRINGPLLIVWDRLAAGTSQPTGPRSPRRPPGAHPSGIPTAVRSRTESGRVHLGSLEAT